MAPEVGSKGRIVMASDVYSFGVVLWEMVTRQVPFQNMGPEQILWQVCMQGKRPTVPTPFPTGISHLLHRCWEQ